MSFSITPRRFRKKYDPLNRSATENNSLIKLTSSVNTSNNSQIATLPNSSRSVTLPLERGETRSGNRFASRNTIYFSSVHELFKVHKKLISPEPAVSTRIARVGESNNGSLLLTTIRFPFHYKSIAHKLKVELLDLFREHTTNSSDGFEVVITFNAILTNQQGTTFSVFYGQDFRANNSAGVAPELKYGEITVVKNIADISKIPTSFDAESLLNSHRRAFESSNVRIHQFINIIYLVIRFLDSSSTRALKKK